MRIFLIGYMGSGKTTIGRWIAQKMHLNFVDMDEEIEKMERKSVSEIFAESGEPYFRELEKEVLRKTAQLDNVIVATGGGVPCYADNLEFMNGTGTTIYIDLTPLELAGRLMQTDLSKRPLLAGLDEREMEQFIARNLMIRAPFYNQAAYKVAGADDEIAKKIIRLIKKR